MIHDDDLLDEGRVQPDYGTRGPILAVSIYRDRACTDQVDTVHLVPGVDTLTITGPATLRFNETESVL